MSVDTLLIHAISSSTKNNAAKYSHNSIQGHHHSLFEINYAADMNNIRWSMTVGTLMDSKSLAAAYASGMVLKRSINGVGVILGEKKNHLVISDLHIPFHHRDAFDFLESVAHYYDTKVILNSGDVVDNHAGSFHDSEPTAMSPEAEYEEAQKYLVELQGIFPEMTIVLGNHDKIPARHLKQCGLPVSMLNNYNQMFNLSDKWIWKPEHRFDSSNGTPLLVPMVLKKNGRWDGRVNGVKV